MKFRVFLVCFTAIIVFILFGIVPVKANEVENRRAYKPDAAMHFASNALNNVKRTSNKTNTIKFSRLSNELEPIVTPIDGELVIPFSKESKYGNGVSSIKYSPNSPNVKAGISGKVTFVGNVAGISYVTVLSKSKMLKLTYSPMVKVFVEKGDDVGSATILGETDAKPNLFSFSVRIKSGSTWDYVNPILFYKEVDILGKSDYVYFNKVQRDFNLEFFKKLIIYELSKIKPISYESFLRLINVYQNLSNCSTQVSKISLNNRAVFVPGINTYAGSGHFPMDVDYKTLGYEKAQINFFSYKNKKLDQDYIISDTYGSTKDFAIDLFKQLEHLAPSTQIDLIAHSQGGVVVKEFLQNHYKGSVLEGKIDHIVMFSAPLEGTPFAGLRQSKALKSVLDKIPSKFLDSDSLKQMTEFESQITSSTLPKEIEYLSIGSNFDFVVPATNTGFNAKKSTNISVNAGVLNGHSAIKTDGFATESAMAFLSNQTLPCLGAIDIGSSLVFPSIIEAIY
jgi:hypothetical protein